MHSLNLPPSPSNGKTSATIRLDDGGFWAQLIWEAYPLRATRPEINVYNHSKKREVHWFTRNAQGPGPKEVHPMPAEAAEAYRSNTDGAEAISFVCDGILCSAPMVAVFMDDVSDFENPDMLTGHLYSMEEVWPLLDKIRLRRALNKALPQGGAEPRGPRF